MSAPESGAYRPGTWRRIAATLFLLGLLLTIFASSEAGLPGAAVVWAAFALGFLCSAAAVAARTPEVTP